VINVTNDSNDQSVLTMVHLPLSCYITLTYLWQYSKRMSCS